jgi:maltose O-acetyltransferase
MPAEQDKMLAGELYDPMDAALVAGRHRARDLFHAYNLTNDAQAEERRRLLNDLLGYQTDVYIEPPFFCDYGTNISFGSGVYFNFNCVVLDVAKVTIGDRTLFGPNVQIYAATHPMAATIRRGGLELGKPVTIGADVWVGGGAVICPGVTIGDEAVIGAGSVVTRDIPPRVFAAGNPCRVIRVLSDDD